VTSLQKLFFYICCSGNSGRTYRVFQQLERKSRNEIDSYFKMEEGNDRINKSADCLLRPKSALSQDFDQLTPPHPPPPSPSIQGRYTAVVPTPPRRRSFSFSSHDTDHILPPAPSSSPNHSVSSSLLLAENEYVPIMGKDPSRMESKQKDHDEVDVYGAIELTGCAGSCFCHPESKCHRALALLLMCILGFGSYFCYDNPGALQVSKIFQSGSNHLYLFKKS